MDAMALIGDLGVNVVDDAEIAKCRAVFNSYDDDRDGKLTYAQLLTCVRVCGGNPSVDEFKELVQVVDTKLVSCTLSSSLILQLVMRTPTLVLTLLIAVPFFPISGRSSDF